MSRSDPWLIACAMAAAVLAGCGPERTRIRLDVPPAARGHVTTVEVLAWRAGGAIDPCAIVLDWVDGTCPQTSCADEPSFAALGEPIGRATLEADDGGVLHGEIRLGDDRPWAVTVVAHVEGAAPLLTGCVPVVTSGTDVTIELRHPWCAAPPCDGSALHPDCRASLARLCDIPGGFRDASEVRCTSSLVSTETWEHDGASCPPNPPDDRYLAGPCQMAEILCEPGMPAARDLICPVEGGDVCLATGEPYAAVKDRDCDGVLAYCMGDCDPVTHVPEVCASDGCNGRTECRGTTLVCSVAGSPEICDNLDNDCDDLVDGRAAVPSCNRMRTDTTPAADGCTEGRCQCGAGAACEGRQVCCNGACVELGSNSEHCGRCRAPCTAAEVCELGTCEAVPVPDAGAPECSVPMDCNRMGTELAPRADGCMGGRCTCGRGMPCERPGTACCRLGCVNTETDRLNCGTCGHTCDGPCLGGTCR